MPIATMIGESIFMCPPANNTTEEISGPVVSLIGDVEHREMRPVFGWMNEHILPQTRIWTVHSTIAERLGTATDPIPDLMVVLQCEPNEYSRSEVNQLLAFAPLARVVVCAGAWCESDGRNRDLWPQAMRVPIWSSTARLQHEWQVLSGTSVRSPLLWSASKEEVFAFDASSDSFHERPQAVLIDSPDHAYQRFLGKLLATEGHSVVADSPSLILFDADPWNETRIEALRTARDRWPHAEICVVSNSAQAAWARELRESGITHVRQKLSFSRQHG